MQIETSTGFKCDIDERKLIDYRFQKAVTKASKNINGALFELVDMLLGDDTALTEHCAEDGICSIDRVIQEVSEIILQLTENKEIKK
ncbi:MAG: hypothetical protein IJS61_03545 [Firmicutes bacterium]|nr:hypothetical protein [Bacillota bacterium]